MSMDGYTVSLGLPDCAQWEGSTPQDAVASFLNFAQHSSELYVYVVQDNATGQVFKVDLAEGGTVAPA